MAIWFAVWPQDFLYDLLLSCVTLGFAVWPMILLCDLWLCWPWSNSVRFVLIPWLQICIQTLSHPSLNNCKQTTGDSVLINTSRYCTMYNLTVTRQGFHVFVYFLSLLRQDFPAEVLTDNNTIFSSYKILFNLHKIAQNSRRVSSPLVSIVVWRITSDIYNYCIDNNGGNIPGSPRTTR